MGMYVSWHSASHNSCASRSASVSNCTSAAVAMPNCSILGIKLRTMRGAVVAVRPHRGPAADRHVLDHRRPRQSRLAKHVIKPASDVVMDATTAERLGDPVMELLPESDRRRSRDADAEIGFLHNDHAAAPDVAGNLAQRRDRVGLIDQDESADNRVEGLRRRIGVGGPFLELDVCQATRFRPLAGDRQHLRIDVDADDRSRRTDQLRREKADIARSTAEIQNTHPLGDSRPPKEAIERRPEEIRLFDQPLTFGLRAS